MKEFHDKNKIIKALENFEKDMQLKPQVYKKQKKQIISVIQKVENITENKRNKLKTTLALILLFLVMTSPLYSTTAANFIEMIVPIKFSNDNQSRLDANIIKIVKQSGYNYDSVSLSTNPFTVEIVLLSSNTSLHQKKTVLMPKIKELLK